MPDGLVPAGTAAITRMIEGMLRTERRPVAFASEPRGPSAPAKTSAGGGGLHRCLTT